MIRGPCGEDPCELHFAEWVCCGPMGSNGEKIPTRGPSTCGHRAQLIDQPAGSILMKAHSKSYLSARCSLKSLPCSCGCGCGGGCGGGGGGGGGGRCCRCRCHCCRCCRCCCCCFSRSKKPISRSTWPYMFIAAALRTLVPGVAVLKQKRPCSSEAVLEKSTREKKHYIAKLYV